MLLEKIYSNKQAILKSALQSFELLNLQPKIGIELEFYLQNQGKPASPETTFQFISHLKTAIQKQNINLLGIEPEQGLGQIEIKTLPYLDIEKLCDDVLKIKEITKDLSQNLNPDLEVNFTSQPYPDDCGSALQINFSLMQNGEYLFAKNEQYLLNCVKSVLKLTKEMMLIFAPKAEDYWRFDWELNRNLHQQKKFTAPVNISWGYNNRTALVRIPQTKKDEDRRLEFRLGSSSANVYLACGGFLLAILEGMNGQKNVLSEAIYGNAFDSQYNLEALPCFTEAQDYFFNDDNPLINKIFAIFGS